MKKTGLIIAVLILYGNHLTAQDSLVIQSLDSIWIVGEKRYAPASPVQTLSGPTLQNLRVHSVADALRYFSGVQIKDYGGIGGLKTVNIRSLGSHHTGVYYDGIQIGNAQNGVVDLGRFSLDNVSSVALHNGQKSNLLQTARDFASANAIYITAHVPRFDSLHTTNLLATIKAGSFATFNPSFLWEQKLSNTISLSLNTEWLSTNGSYRFRYAKQDGYDTTEKRQNGDVQAFRAEAALYGKVNNGEWKTRVYWYNAERGYPGAAVREQPGIFRNQDRQWDNNVFIQSSFQKAWGKKYALLVNGKYAYDYLHYVSDPRLDVSTMYVNNRFEQQEWYGSVAQSYQLRPYWGIGLSADMTYNRLNADMQDFRYPVRLTNQLALSSTFQLKRWQVQGALLGSFVSDETKQNHAKKHQSEYAPSLVASWQPFARKNVLLRSFYKRIFRMPTLNDLYYTFIGNANLLPEFTHQYNAGFTYQKNYKGWLKYWEWKTDLYFNQVTNKIIAMPTSNQFRWTMVNLGYTEVRGMDVAHLLRWQLSSTVDLDTRINYTYQKAQDFTDRLSTYYGGLIPYVPLHSGSVVIGSSYKLWHLQYSFIYTGERYEAVANTPENYSRPWYTHDMAITRNYVLKNMPGQLTLSVNNLFNQQYEVVQWYPMPGINTKLTARINIL